jgi:hypothetical protein
MQRGTRRRGEFHCFWRLAPSLRGTRYSTHLHIGNCILKDRNHPAYGDHHPRFGVKGGENDVDQLREFFATLFEEGFLKNDPAAKAGEKPLISFEVKPMAGEDPALVLANSKRVFKRPWELLEVGKESV